MSNDPQKAYSFRPIRLVEEDNDLPFLARLYASTRLEEMALSGWPQHQIDSFLQQQFEAQHQFYMEQFAGASFDLVLATDGSPMGRLYLEERDDEFRIIDIALLPEFRGQGIGGNLMKNIITKAFEAEKMVRIHVEQNNPAMKLYLRLGFQKIEEKGVYHLMEIRPSQQAGDSAA